MNKPVPPLKDKDHQKEDGATTPSRGGEREPRLPHERDESSDSQKGPNEETGKVARQATKDVERGLVDTDRGPVLEKINRDHFAAAPRKRSRRSG